MTKVKEIWKDIPGYGGRYKASSLGHIKSLLGLFKSGRHLKPRLNHRGYHCVVLSESKGSKQIQVTIHRLVALTFIQKRHRHRLEINHKDGNKLNNHVSNLEWCTKSENVLHAYRIGIKKPRRGNDSPLMVLTDNDISQIREILRSPNKPTQKDIAKQFGVSASLISQINVGTARSYSFS